MTYLVIIITRRHQPQARGLVYITTMPSAEFHVMAHCDFSIIEQAEVLLYTRHA